MVARSWAIEFGKDGIRVNAVAPGKIATPNVTEMIGEEAFREAGALTPRRRLGDPHEIAHAIAFLASPQASYNTGQTLCVDGDFMMAHQRCMARSPKHQRGPGPR